jgi:hypothetical protein
LLAALIVLVKEDGAVLCAASRILCRATMDDPGGPPRGASPVIAAALSSLLGLLLVFILEHGPSSAASRSFTSTQDTAWFAYSVLENWRSSSAERARLPA